VCTAVGTCTIQRDSANTITPNFTFDNECIKNLIFLKFKIRFLTIFIKYKICSSNNANHLILRSPYLPKIHNHGLGTEFYYPIYTELNNSKTIRSNFDFSYADLKINRQIIYIRKGGREAVLLLEKQKLVSLKVINRILYSINKIRKMMMGMSLVDHSVHHYTAL